MFERKWPLPIMAHILAARILLIAPAVELTVESAASSELPFRLGRQALFCPATIGLCVFPADVHDGVIFLADNIASRTRWVLPASSKHRLVPQKMGPGMVEVDIADGRGN